MKWRGRLDLLDLSCAIEVVLVMIGSLAAFEGLHAEPEAKEKHERYADS